MIDYIKKVWRKIIKELISLPLVLKCKYYENYPQEYLIIKASVKFDNIGNLRHNNWGDDMNIFFLTMITGKRVVILPDTFFSIFFHVKNYICIGSILTFFDMSNSIVWGSGIIDNRCGMKFISKPLKIAAVRGPLSRDWILKQGIDCPEIYGDPILLLPKYYKPKVKKKEWIGIIPHFSEINDSCIINLLKNDDIKLILTRNYDRWQSFVDSIIECNLVISSSLHGLIVAYAYGIPAVWIKSSGKEEGWNTKFYDFYYSINIRNVEPYILNDNTNLDDIKKKVIDYSESFFDADKLVKACPFAIEQ